jgi:hypothetical protein
MRIERLPCADHNLDRAVLHDADGRLGTVGERRCLTGQLRPEHAFAFRAVVEAFLAEPQHLGSVQAAGGLLDAIAEPLRKVGWEDRPLTPDQLIQRAALRIGQLHVSMLGGATDMPESPDDILRALADPERLAIAGMLATGDRTAAEVADALSIAPKRTRTHLGKLTAAGVVRVAADRRTYRLDPETLRRAPS